MNKRIKNMFSYARIKIPSRNRECCQMPFGREFRFYLLALGCWLLTSLAIAAQEDTIVVTASRIETPAKSTGSSVTVISNEDIKQSGQTSVVETLKNVPGLTVVESGGPAGDASIFIRGAASYHTLVLIDGVPAYDPMSTTRAFDFAHLDTVNIERIEVVRGPQSTLYGSDAIGGVVNIITKKGKGEPEHTVCYNSFKMSPCTAH